MDDLASLHYDETPKVHMSSYSLSYALLQYLTGQISSLHRMGCSWNIYHNCYHYRIGRRIQ